jgi:recombination protein RecR
LELPSKILAEAIQQFSKLPGIGKKTALRLVLHLAKQENASTHLLASSISDLTSKLLQCKTCFSYADANVCSICSNASRKQNIICVVENIRDLIAIENTQHYNGVYHVLGGLISPLDGVGPTDIFIEQLITRAKKQAVDEIIFALSPNVQGDTTLFYIQKQLQDNIKKFTTISRGIAFGGELEYADELTLGRSLMNRMPVENYVS